MPGTTTSSSTRRDRRRSAPTRREGTGGGGTRSIRWRRFPGRIILAACFLVGAAALAVMVLPFESSTADGIELHCGPALFEVLMPADPAFDDIAENVACSAPAQNRLLIAGAVLVGVVVVASVTERRTRRGSTRRDTRWLSTSTAGRRRWRRRARSPAPSDAQDALPGPDRPVARARELPAERS